MSFTVHLENSGTISWAAAQTHTHQGASVICEIISKQKFWEAAWWACQILTPYSVYFTCEAHIVGCWRDMQQILFYKAFYFEHNNHERYFGMKSTQLLRDTIFYFFKWIVFFDSPRMNINFPRGKLWRTNAVSSFTFTE